MKIKSTAVSLAACLGLYFAGGQADARPVSYPGGWTLMQMNDGDMSSLHFHYSPTFQDSIGFYAERNWGADFTFSGLQYNRLVKRWNGEKSQANLYAKAAVGGAEAFGGESNFAGFAGVAADWETRRWFLSYEARGYALGFDEQFRQSARAGVAPYIGDYGDLHTWLMLEVSANAEDETPVKLTPLVRFFYGVQLLEIGYTPETEELLANFIIRF